MSREIKFRGWDGKGMNFRYMVARPQWVNLLSILQDEDFAKEAYSVQEWKLMQFTGLKDKNGAAIYEGDIVVKEGYIYFDNNEPNYRGVVEWVFSQWQIILHCVNPNKRGISHGINKGINDEGKEEGSITDFEVIGNIYENPELLP